MKPILKIYMHRKEKSGRINTKFLMVVIPGL